MTCNHSNLTGGMDSTTIVGEDGDSPARVKFLCSFGGGILPRPSDGRLRYVGGETRIVSIPRDSSYEELISRMQEIFEGATTLKYQQPDEDLDALVSVVNDDDVLNLMEEYDKLDAGDAIIRLRLFLSSHPDLDCSPRFHSDHRETERRYVDALNSLADASSDTIHGEELEMTDRLPPINVHPRQQQPQHLRYNELEAPWSPAYYSSGHRHPQDSRSISDFPPSPSTGRYRLPYGDLHDQPMDRMMEDYGRHPAFADNVLWQQQGLVANEKAGFHGSLGHSQNAYEGSNTCEHCHMSYQRNQTLPEACYPDARWRQGSRAEHCCKGSDLVQFHTAERFSSREKYLLSPDKALEHGIYSKEQHEHRPFCNESHNQERVTIPYHHAVSQRIEENKAHQSGVGRIHHLSESGSNCSFPFNHDIHALPSNYIDHDDPQKLRSGIDMGNEIYHEQNIGAGHHLHVPPLEDSTAVRYGNFPPTCAIENHSQVPHGSTTIPPSWIKVQNPIRGIPYEGSSILPQTNGVAGAGFLGGEVSPPFSRVGVDDHNCWGGHCFGPFQRVFYHDGLAKPENLYERTPIFLQDKQQMLTPEPIPSQFDMPDISSVSQASTLASSPQNMNPTMHGSILNRNSISDVNMAIPSVDAKGVPSEASIMQTFNDSLNKEKALEFSSVKFERLEAHSHVIKNAIELAQSSCILPELIDSVNKVALDGVEELKHKADDNDDVHDSDAANIKETRYEALPINADKELDHEYDAEQADISRIEPTKAEEEALSRGLQTIRNDDLEEIKELGSGTYGAVYHGKWKGSDVAIKRIKASCFAGKPSERERLITDFWKEASILSSLHHPNVVSFYGVVRDGPDGTLATVTEFMINGSLKQFLHKKDRTIDRRKRIIIALDAAFGMEYLHGKNIVHFDLKCENLLVNMRDPHRPVCKIGDLGLSKVRQHTLVSGGIRGTLPWMAPELLSGKSNMVTEKIDIYSFGIVMWEVLTGEEPYGDMHCASVIGGIVNNSLRPEIPTWCDPEWKSLMESCWSSDPCDRPSFSEISQRLRKMASSMNVK